MIIVVVYCFTWKQTETISKLFVQFSLDLLYGIWKLCALICHFRVLSYFVTDLAFIFKFSASPMWWLISMEISGARGLNSTLAFYWSMMILSFTQTQYLTFYFYKLNIKIYLYDYSIKSTTIIDTCSMMGKMWHFNR